MNGDVESLSDREREALQLLGRGHDAKSIASTLNLSVHTVNERLRAARRKLGVSSSREAARLLLASGGGSEDPNNLGYNKFGVASVRPGLSYPRRAFLRATLVSVTIGAIMIVVLTALLITAHAGKGVPSNPVYPTAAEPINSLPSLFAVSDYPAQALARHQQGTTTFKLRVGAHGRVDGCEVERSSGSTALDQATCRIVTRRSRFRPAVNSAGHPIASVYNGAIHWKL
jgi:TonB family protein